MNNTPQPQFVSQQVQQAPQQFYGNLYPQAQPNQQIMYTDAVEQQANYSQPIATQPIVEAEDVVNKAWVSEKDIRFKDGVVSVCLNLFVPGLGHLLMGQQTKALTFFAMQTLLGLLIGVLSMLLVGFLFIIPALFVMAAYLYDGFVLAERMKKGYPIMKGEIAASWVKYSGACLFTKPSFVTGSADAPQDWHVKVSEVQV